MNYPATIRIPPLENGDRLTKAEFEYRYDAMPHLKKAELIEGVVYMASPLRFESHAKPHALIMAWLGTYYAATPGVDFADNATVRLDGDNEPQPDALLRLPQAAGGQSQLSQDDYLERAPELIVEVAASSASYDLHDKYRMYCRNQVPEYIVWQVYDQQLSWFVLTEDHYVTLEPDADGLIFSQVFPGLVLDVAALLAGNLAQVLNKLQYGLQTEAHHHFVAYLAQHTSLQDKL